MGIDPAANSIGTAELHTFRDPELLGRVSYRACTLEELSQGLEGEGEGEGGEAVEGEEESFDAVVASEVVEHLADLDTFALCCGDVLKVAHVTCCIVIVRCSVWLSYEAECVCVFVCVCACQLLHTLY